MKLVKGLKIIGLLLVGGFMFSACKNDDPSIVKIFVRSNNNELLANARVILIGDQFSNPPTDAFADTALTNSSGYATFNMDEFYKNKNKDEKTGYFNIKVKRDLLEGTGYIRSRAHIIAVETVHVSQ